MRQVVLISGRLRTGRTGLAKKLKSEFGYSQIKTSQVLKHHATEMNLPSDRLSLQEAGRKMNIKTKGAWIADAVKKRIAKLPENKSIVVDSVYNKSQIEHFRKMKDWKVFHVHLNADTEELSKRFIEYSNKNENLTMAQADFLRPENRKVLSRDADLKIDTGRTLLGDTFVRTAVALGHFAPPNLRCVDVLIGGQFGSEGKGQIAGYLSKEYDVLVRVGGPNAGHSVSNEHGVTKYHHLPSGCRDTDAEILIGPGAVIDVERLLEEIEMCELTEERLFIDPQCMTICKSDIEAEEELVNSIASTGSGVGYATARKITNRFHKNVRLAKNYPALKAYVGGRDPYRGKTLGRLEKAYAEGKSILLEGTQGSGLSIHHGLYPYVTSRDTNVAGCLAEAGISPSRVRRILMVVRSFPIRVGDPDESGKTSGPLKLETSFSEIARMSKLNATEVEQAEITTTTGRKRRVGQFDWELFRTACALNAPTDIVLTFADYYNKQNQDARRFDQLHESTIQIIEELENFAQAPVSLINTRFERDDKLFDRRSVIDRRSWTTNKIQRTRARHK
ncbi:MAG: adenylosuccinate synthetase [Candidatus Poribacteria bacterium]|nr:adenylosuccinate synthetase [Candidatus Poribacteria bacterium]